MEILVNTTGATRNWPHLERVTLNRPNLKRRKPSDHQTSRCCKLVLCCIGQNICTPSVTRVTVRLIRHQPSPINNSRRWRSALKGNKRLTFSKKGFNRKKTLHLTNHFGSCAFGPLPVTSQGQQSDVTGLRRHTDLAAVCE
jgi:hypothetical protein